MTLDAFYKMYVSYLQYIWAGFKKNNNTTIFRLQEILCNPGPGTAKPISKLWASVYKLHSLAKKLCDYNILTQAIWIDEIGGN